MDFFLPSLIVLILSGIIVFAFLPRMAPIILLFMSAGLLGFGIYHHYKIFEDEYRFSTWQDQLKIYAPGVAIGVTVLFLIGFILSFFGGASVPIPPIPEIPSLPNIPIVNNVANTITNTVKNIMNVSVPEPEPTPAPPTLPEPILNNNRGPMNRGSSNRLNNRIRGIRPSFIEEI